jgi:hippurate hydrolase
MLRCCAFNPLEIKCINENFIHAFNKNNSKIKRDISFHIDISLIQMLKTKGQSLTIILSLMLQYSFAQKEVKETQTILIQETAINWYQALHQNPELSMFEDSTSKFLQSKLRKMGYSIIDSLGYKSFAAILKNGDGPTIMYRTDMDALPIKEATGWTFASSKTTIKDNVETPIMHACGHDIHMATWMNVAQTMMLQRKKWKGTLVLLAQSAEEIGRGAKGVLASQAWTKIPQASHQLAYHVNANLEVGELGLCDGYAMAAVDMMNITIYGQGGHGAEPQKTIDPILLSAQFITQIQSIVSRNLSPNDPAVITVGSIQGGTVGNVIPNEVQLKLTIRTYSPESRALVMKRIKEIGNHLAQSAGLTESKLPKYDLLDMSIPPVFNSLELSKEINASLKDRFTLIDIPPTMIGEDFGLYSQGNKIPSYLIWLGVLSKMQKENYKNDPLGIPSLHSSRFSPDYENTIPKGTEAMSTLLIHLFNKK